MNKERRLGRGLEALLGRPASENDATEPRRGQPLDQGASLREEPQGAVEVHVYEIENNPFQPRREFEATAIAELSESLREHGMIQPIVVRRQGQRYQLIAGERRLRAAIAAGWQRVPVQIREADDRQMSEVAIVENLHRKDLNALEKAESFAQYIQRYACTQEELAKRLNIDRSTVTNMIRLLELPEAIQQSVRSGNLSQGHARALLPLGDEREQLAFSRRIREEALSVRATEELVQQAIHSADNDTVAVAGTTHPRGKTSKRRGAHATNLEQELRASLGTKVDLKQKAGGRGQIVIHFSSLEEFERLRQQLCGKSRAAKAG